MSNSNGAPFLLKLLCFLFPVIGWVLYFVFKDDNPVKANDCAKAAWIGFGISFAIGFIGGLVGAV